MSDKNTPTDASDETNESGGDVAQEKEPMVLTDAVEDEDSPAKVRPEKTDEVQRPRPTELAPTNGVPAPYTSSEIDAAFRRERYFDRIGQIAVFGAEVSILVKILLWFHEMAPGYLPIWLQVALLFGGGAALWETSGIVSRHRPFFRTDDDMPVTWQTHPQRRIMRFVASRLRYLNGGLDTTWKSQIESVTSLCAEVPNEHTAWLAERREINRLARRNGRRGNRASEKLRKTIRHHEARRDRHASKITGILEVLEDLEYALDTDAADMNSTEIDERLSTLREAVDNQFDAREDLEQELHA